MTKAQQTIINGILNNERCQMCGRKVENKCIVCLLNNNTAGYCSNHHIEHNHKPTWISAFE